MSSAPPGAARAGWDNGLVTVLDVTEADFEAQVIERSALTPVVVDFWAAWCGPCRALTPLLEEAAAQREGEVVLAKVDTDQNQQLAQAFGIQGIPAVKAFRDGALVSEFVGAQPRPTVQAFFDALVPSAADRLAAAGDEASLREALALEPSRADAAVALARILIARGEGDEAERVLEPVTGSFEADGLAARIRLQRADKLADAFTALDQSDDERAFELLLEAVREEDDVRLALIGELDRRGPADPLTQQTRRRLASALF
jgi:putative thioredoxin